MTKFAVIWRDRDDFVQLVEVVEAIDEDDAQVESQPAGLRIFLTAAVYEVAADTPMGEYDESDFPEPLRGN